MGGFVVFVAWARILRQHRLSHAFRLFDANLALDAVEDCVLEIQTSTPS